MGTRVDLQHLLEGILTDLGLSKNVYFEPPGRLSYPCIKYELSAGDTFHANNQPYLFKKKYLITVIDRNPDSLIPDYVAMLPGCRFDRTFTSDNLHHYVFTIQY